MISPHELRDKTFSRAVRGYNITEVDEYFDFLIDKYTELYKENSELERKLHIVSQKYDELSNDEKSIRTTLLKAQKLSEAITENAKKEADATLAGVSSRCDEVIDAAKEKVREQKEALLHLRDLASDFKKRICDEYVEHIKLLRSMETSIADEDAISEKAVDSALSGSSESDKGKDSAAPEEKSGKVPVQSDEIIFTSNKPAEDDDGVEDDGN